MNTAPIYSAIQAENYMDARALLQTELEPMKHEFKVRFAVKCAYLTLPIFEKKYPKDNRPRAAIEAAEKWIKEPTEENKKTANAAANATYAAANVAYDAANAAYAAYATNAAYATANATANAAAYAAAYAADAADAADAAKNKKSMWLNIIGMYETMIREEKLACI